MVLAPPYLLFYRLSGGGEDCDETVTLLRILDGRRDLKDLL